jgi:hypothetical protein
MTLTTWAELGQHKLSYVCTQGIERWEYCRALAAHMRWEAQAGQWMVASFIGTAFILVSVAASMLLADRRQRAAVRAHQTAGSRPSIMPARRRWSWKPALVESALA